MARTYAPRGFVPELDGLRGLAILLVMIHRFWPRAGGLAAHNGLAGIGWIGVDLFFVVSGFLITGILLDTRDDPHHLRNFYARRVLRIFPLFYVLVAGMLVVFPLHDGAVYLRRAGSPLWYLLQLGNMPEAVLRHDPPYWLAPVWSLAIEEQFYLSFPWLVRALDRRRLAKILVGVIAFGPVVRTFGLLWFPQLDRFQYEFTLCRFDEIAAGCLLAVIVRQPTERQPRSRTLAAIAVGAVAVALVSGLDRATVFGRTLGYSVVGAGFAATVLLVVRARGDAHLAALRFSPLRYLGKLCFGLYLLHRPADTLVTSAAVHLGADPLAGWLIPVKLAAAVALASLSWFVLERPILRQKRRFGSRRHPSEQPRQRAPAAAVTVTLTLALLAGCHAATGRARPHGGDACSGTCTSPDASRSGIDGSLADAARADATSGEADARRDAGTPSDASRDDATGAGGSDAGSPSAIVLYPEGRRHSPITAQVAAHLAAIAGAATAPRVFAKVGDSITASTSFLTCFDGTVELGSHGALASTLAYFAAGNAAGSSPYARVSLAATGGWTTGDVLAGSPSPLDQEASAIDPRDAVMMLGTNDDRYGDTFESFGANLWTIVDDLTARGIIPILSTIPPIDGDPDADARVRLFDGLIRAIAQGCQIPLVDLHAELVNLPSHGLSADGVHPDVAPTGACDLTDAGLQYGYNVRNLITLEALDRLRAALAGQPPDATAPVRTGTGTHADPIVAALPIADLGDTGLGDATFDTYPSCDPTSRTGREIVYQLELPAATTIDAYLVTRGPVTAAIHVLPGSLAPGGCVAAGASSASATVGPGPVYLVVDSTTPASEGPYLLVVQVH